MRFLTVALLLCAAGLPCSINVTAAESTAAESTAAVTTAAVTTAAKKDVVFPGDIAAGKTKSEDERCQECHGADGNVPQKNDAGKVPKLAGQHPEYLLKQFLDFRSVARKHDFMNLMAKTVDEADAADIIAYYASQPLMQGDGSGANELGKKLFINGDPARNIQSCASCHGITGKGVAAGESSPLPNVAGNIIPVIGGQDWFYLEKQLQDWRSRERTNSADNVMTKVTAALTDAEIKALTDYIAGL